MRKICYTPQQEAEIVGLLKQNPKTKRSELAEMFGIPAASIQSICKKHGFVASKKASPVTNLKDLDAEIEAMKAKIQELAAKRLSIRFEVVASVAGWLRFFRNEGPSKLREFIEGINKNGHA